MFTFIGKVSTGSSKTVCDGEPTPRNTILASDRITEYLYPKPGHRTGPNHLLVCRRKCESSDCVQTKAQIGPVIQRGCAMISQNLKPLSVLCRLCKPTLTAALVGMALAYPPIVLHAAQRPPIVNRSIAAAIDPAAQPEPHRFANRPDNHIIRFDNSEGTETLEFRENLLGRQCVASVTPDSLTLAPGETAEVRLDIRDSESSGCAGEPKYVLWRAAVAKPGSQPLGYQLLFTEDPREETHGGTQIRSTLSSRPGTPYAATCGDRACFDEWVPASPSGSVIFFYERR